MTKLRIHHETLYTYTRAVKFGPHRVVLRPREGHDLRVESMKLTTSPKAEIRWIRDVFGNSIALLRFSRAAATLRIVSDIELSRTPPYPHRRQDTRPTPFPPQYDPLEHTVVSAYRALTYPDDAEAVARWVKSVAPKKPRDVEHMIRALNRAIHERIKYRRREEKGVLSPGQTIVGGVGSCRDFATLLLDAARTVGIAARFASGYMESNAAEAGHGSTHAWVEIYLPGHGWRGYDPTAGKETDERHVATGLSNHPRGVMPVSGSFFGKASEFKAMTVAVRLSRGEAETDRSYTSRRLF